MVNEIMAEDANHLAVLINHRKPHEFSASGLMGFDSA